MAPNYTGTIFKRVITKNSMLLNLKQKKTLFRNNNVDYSAKKMYATLVLTE